MAVSGLAASAWASTHPTLRLTLDFVMQKETLDEATNKEHSHLFDIEKRKGSAEDGVLEYVEQTQQVVVTASSVARDSHKNGWLASWTVLALLLLSRLLYLEVISALNITSSEGEQIGPTSHQLQTRRDRNAIRGASESARAPSSFGRSGRRWLRGLWAPPHRRRSLAAVLRRARWAGGLVG
ncbi:uncharacterized protein J3D65DRAFT_37267 [Phyllosticta citribraziliensis]|uniref:Uncharacterized protein n=1 Tax=Phyllosticta citribraziliensis TaxID=989973 RepID=A0ABR1MDY7_9PEZI